MEFHSFEKPEETTVAAPTEIEVQENTLTQCQEIAIPTPNRGRGRGRGKPNKRMRGERTWTEFVKPKHHRADEHVGRLPWLPPRKPFMWKTTMCLDVDKNCRFGKHCRYAHSEEELRKKPDDNDPLVKHILVLENEIEEYKKELGRVRSELNRVQRGGGNGFMPGRGRGRGKTMIIREIIREVPVDFYAQYNIRRGASNHRRGNLPITRGRGRPTNGNQRSGEFNEAFHPY